MTLVRNRAPPILLRLTYDSLENSSGSSPKHFATCRGTISTSARIGSRTTRGVKVGVLNWIVFLICVSITRWVKADGSMFDVFERHSICWIAIFDFRWSIDFGSCVGKLSPIEAVPNAICLDFMKILLPANFSPSNHDKKVGERIFTPAFLHESLQIRRWRVEGASLARTY